MTGPYEDERLYEHQLDLPEPDDEDEWADEADDFDDSDEVEQ